MKRWMIGLFACVLWGFFSVPALAESRAPALPEDMLPAYEASFPGNQRYPVYRGPGKEFGRAGNGQAVVSTNDWIQVFGTEASREGSWMMVQYGLSEEKMRIGWISTYDLPDDFSFPPAFQWAWGRVRTVRTAALTDDPLGAMTALETLPAGTLLCRLESLGPWTYVETLSGKSRGFIPSDALVEEAVSYAEDSALQSAAQMLTDAGIAFQVTGLQNGPYNWKTLYANLKNGGSFQYAYCINWGFDRYDFRCWDFFDMSDLDLEQWMNYLLSLLADVENDRAPEEELQPDYQGDVGQWNQEATVSGGLNSLERFGRQALDLLLTQLEKHDGQDEVNSLRARLASRILGRLDHTPVDPALGCAWYDALQLSVQDALPPVDAALYVDDPLLCQATQALIAYEEENQRGWNRGLDVDSEKARAVVSLHVQKIKQTGDQAILWAVEEESTYALYDGVRMEMLSGHYVPCRITLARQTDGTWTLQELVTAEDGDLYAPSILRFCDNDQALANRLMQEDTYDTLACFQKYLAAHGYTPELPE